MGFDVEKRRIVLTRAAAGIAALLLLCSNSAWETQNELVALTLFTVGMVLVGAASLGRMWCSLYIAGYKDERLITQGPYSMCRNPLYFFSLLGTLGIGLCTETFFFPVLFVLLFALYYPFVIKGEEKRLGNLFGDAFDAYAQKVPPFFPRFSGMTEPKTYPVNPRVFRVHIYSALWFVWIVGGLEFVEGLREAGVLGWIWTVY